MMKLIVQSLEGIPEEMTRLQLPAGFDVKDWGTIERYYREKIHAGHLQWELDLTRINFFSSTMLGLLIGFNTILQTRGGTLRVIVQKDSSLLQLLKLSKVDRIIAILEE